MTHPQDVPAPSPTVSEAMRDAVAREYDPKAFSPELLAYGGAWEARRQSARDIAASLIKDAGPIASALAALERENATLRASAERMEAALKPLAEEADFYDEPVDGVPLLPGGTPLVGLTLDHARAARAALTPKETPDA